MSKLRESARGEICQMQSPVCNRNPETVVLCHINSHRYGKGIGIKADDLAGFYGCSSCHDLFDGRLKTDIDRNKIENMALHAVVLTHLRMRDKGVIGYGS